MASKASPRHGRALAERGVRLLVDFVPNHVGPDHRWLKKHPEYFIRGATDDLAADPAGFLAVGKAVVARGRDPFFPPWPDVVQLNAFAPELRRAAADTLIDIAAQADGVRCDMAMLMLNDVFARTWGDRAGAAPEQEYWTEVIGAVRAAHPDFVFVAEAYWDLEWQLQQLGFDFCYDKRLYDRLLHEDASSVRGHLHADLDYQRRLVRFLENHDEPRAAAVLAAGARTGRRRRCRHPAWSDALARRASSRVGGCACRCSSDDAPTNPSTRNCAPSICC